MSIKIRKDVLASSIIQASKPATRRVARLTADYMAKFATEFIADGFVTDRPPARRRTADIHLINAMLGLVEEDGDNVRAVLTHKRGSSDVKVRVMNNGARAHDIRPQGQFLTFPGFVEGFTARRSAVFNAYSSDRSARARVVNHPGRSATARGTKFMQRARAKAVAQLR